MVLDAGSLPASEEPSRTLSNGIASTSMTAAAAMASTAGLRWTVPAQRLHTPGETTPLAPKRRRWRRESTRMPKTPSSAGSRVTAASTVKTTVSAEATARPFRKLTPRTRMPSSAMHTVLPANRTARPEVSMALTAASSGVSPDCRPRRCLVTMNRA